MKRLSIDALKERAENVQNDALMAKISGGTENDCHDEEMGFWDYFIEGIKGSRPW